MRDPKPPLADRRVPGGTGLVALGLLTRSLQARPALSGHAIAGSIQAFPKDLYCLAHHQIPFANSTRLIMEMVLERFYVGYGIGNQWNVSGMRRSLGRGDFQGVFHRSHG